MTDLHKEIADILHQSKNYLKQMQQLGEDELYVEPKIDEPSNQESQRGKQPINQMKSEEIDSLDALYKKYENCTLCRLSKTRKNIVFGEGNSESDLMLIGEAPGKDEDIQGKPFVGRSGKLLDKILAAIDLNRNDIYIANIIKCRPPGNRDPFDEEVEKCFPILEKQIEIIQPKIILTLGLWASKTLLGIEDSLKNIRGKIYNYKGIKVVPTYHPAALLHNPKRKRPTWEDIKMMKSELDKID